MVKIRRRVDALGRIVIPADMREALDINEGDELDIELVEDGLLIKKHTTGCVICNSKRLTISLAKGRHICMHCTKQAITALQSEGVDMAI